MSDTTNNLALPWVAGAQAQKHVTVNESLASLDAIVQLTVIDRDLTAPPASPAESDRYIVAATATGDWVGHEGSVAVYDGGAWAFHLPQSGWRCWVEDEGRDIIHDGSVWVRWIAFSSNGANMTLQVIEEEVTVSGASVDTTITIPNRAIVFGVTARTTQAITGAASYDCGTASETSKFGGSLGIGAGSTNAGVIGPTAFYSATALRLTANGGNFTGGKVRAAIHFLECGVPTA